MGLRVGNYTIGIFCNFIHLIGLFSSLLIGSSLKDQKYMGLFLLFIFISHINNGFSFLCFIFVKIFIKIMSFLVV
jgi:hypothetical protein